MRARDVDPLRHVRAFGSRLFVECEDRVMANCELCGRPTDAHDQQVRFRLPDPVLRASEQDRAQGTWKTHEDPNAAVMMMVPGLGAFVRALLPVQLTGGHTVTFGVWVSVHADDLKRAFDSWWAPEYVNLTLEGRLANALPPWEVFAAPVSLAVTDPDATPFCVASTDSGLQLVLTREWDHELVLTALPT